METMPCGGRRPPGGCRVGLEVTGRGIVREHQDVFLGQEKIGQTTSGTHCPLSGQGGGYGAP